MGRRYELSESAQPLKIGEVRCFDRLGATKDEYDSFLCIQVTNPNPFFVDGAQVELRWEGHAKSLTTGLDAIPANHTGTYVINISCRNILGLGNAIDPTECTIDFNRYGVFVGEDKPIVEITDSRVIRDETSGLVTQIEVDTKAVDSPECKATKYDLFALFYKQDEIVGVATGMGWIEDIDKPDVMRYVSSIDDYDRYEIVAVNQYERPLFDR